ncbi:PIN domain-containing protein [Haladaptatus sp. DYF46]|uniref:type II toxin-antitoxin system VapC family toxin n=1 Tax=Haladaptatus sp. DYF46 TaxID=2886041 RepID=UPI001E4A989B|nr:PIN domain-containing protein [Haladaptatus sp. DYF46]
MSDKNGSLPVPPEFSPPGQGATPLFLDTSGLYPYFDTQSPVAEAVTQFMQALPELPYRPLLTNQYVVDELITLLDSHVNHATATRAFETLRDSEAIQILSVSDDLFWAAGEQFSEYDDHTLSFTDHLISIQAHRENAEHILTYDPDDFATLGLTPIPRT